MAKQTFTQVTPHIYRLDLSLGLAGWVAVFLVRGKTGWTVIDSGMEQHAPALIEAILAQTQGEKPERLILTHGHPDHAGSALRLREEFRLKVAAGRDEIRYLTEPVFYRKIPATGPIHRPLYYLITLLAQPAMVGRGIDLPLDEKMRLDDMEVFHIPGHTPGMIALLHRPDRALICADAFINRGGHLGDPTKFFTYDPQLNHQSQKKLAALDFDHLISSHGPALMNGGKQAARALVEKHLGKQAFVGSTPAPAARG